MNGGPAFPASHFDLADNEHGMTLRDYFAAKAMASALWNASVSSEKALPALASAVARCSYLVADAMLAERAKEK